MDFFLKKPQKQKKIVIIEDDPMMVEILSRKLANNNFDVKIANDGKQGIDVVLKEKPDLIVLDLLLPEIDGFQVMETIRTSKDGNVAKTPVLVVSNLWSQENIQRLTPLGIIDYMVKSKFTSEEILAKINEVLG
jgi:DNA-binding response OmpR family regulator